MASENVPENSLHQNALSGTSSAMVYTSFHCRSLWRFPGGSLALPWRWSGASLALLWRSPVRLRWVCMAETLQGRTYVWDTSGTRSAYADHTSGIRRSLVTDGSDIGHGCPCPGPHVAVLCRPGRGRAICAAGVRKVGTVWPAKMMLGLALGLGLASGAAWSQPRPTSWQGVPAQVRPEAAETGAPAFTTPTGTGSLFPTAPASGPSSSSGGATGDGSGTLGTMLAQSWGARASDAAQIVGVTPVSLASACVMESGCRTNPGGSGTISGTFQMLDST